MIDLFKELPLPPAIVEFQEKMDWESLVSLALKFRENDDINRWTLGDLSIKAMEWYGVHSVRELAKAIGMRQGTLRGYRDISRIFPAEKREPYLAWTTYRIAGRQKSPDVWIKRSAENSWTPEQLAREIRVKKGGKQESWQEKLERFVVYFGKSGGRIKEETIKDLVVRWENFKKGKA